MKEHVKEILNSFFISVTLINIAMFILGILFGITNGSCRFLWGFLLDKYGFKLLMFIIATTEIISSCVLYFTVRYDWIYIFLYY